MLRYVTTSLVYDMRYGVGVRLKYGTSMLLGDLQLAFDNGSMTTIFRTSSAPCIPTTACPFYNYSGKPARLASKVHGANLSPESR